MAPAAPGYRHRVTDEHVLARVEGRLGHLTLQRPERINALSLGMIAQVQRSLDEWAADPGVELVLIDGAGTRGLCAGGDIREVYEGIHGGVIAPGMFWADEYRMNSAVAHYPKPYVAFMDGVVMGGGVGISAHGSVRIVTERSQVAMPETAIGLCPDVGALYLLARAPGQFGTHAALTGARLDAAQAIHAGLADHLVPSGSLHQIAVALQAGVAALERLPVMDHSTVEHGWIDECYAGDDVTAILARLEAHQHPDAQRAAGILRSMAPTALVVTLRAIRNAASMTVDEVLDQDLRVCSRFLHFPDFAEGIRAQIIDKDRNPRWRPDQLADVDRSAIDEFFAPLDSPSG